ncbi:hypothetical protein XA68_15637 [Ophiocordyceps unilateralis]|uniref:Uncharacterized protein n=1 Tax=Ophiocordyceps unilateralis TaxID=268505 RepID=A0A2A9PKF0_OPHUN|nr:hypothetical protein XA68_15637 [Ophiocordyceps unilateralis]
MKAALALTLFGLGLANPLAEVNQIALRKPNTGAKCTLTCKNLVPIEKLGCRMSQYGCLDRKGKSCGDSGSNRGTLCVVDGPCGAGWHGCLDDKTGQDDNLPAGTHDGHCPGDGDKCSHCRDDAGDICKDYDDKDLMKHLPCVMICLKHCETCTSCKLKLGKHSDHVCKHQFFGVCGHHETLSGISSEL